MYPPTSFPSFPSFPPTPSPRYQDIGAVGTQCAVRRLEGLLETPSPRFAISLDEFEIGRVLQGYVHKSIFCHGCP